MKIATLATVKLEEQDSDELDEISSFNIAGRYDDYKRSFHKRARGRYVSKWFGNAERIYRWLSKLY